MKLYLLPVIFVFLVMLTATSYANPYSVEYDSIQGVERYLIEDYTVHETDYFVIITLKIFPNAFENYGENYTNGIPVYLNDTEIGTMPAQGTLVNISIPYTWLSAEGTITVGNGGMKFNFLDLNTIQTVAPTVVTEDVIIVHEDNWFVKLMKYIRSWFTTDYIIPILYAAPGDNLSDLATHAWALDSDNLTDYIGSNDITDTAATSVTALYGDGQQIGTGGYLKLASDLFSNSANGTLHFCVKPGVADHTNNKLFYQDGSNGRIDFHYTADTTIRYESNDGNWDNIDLSAPSETGYTCYTLVRIPGEKLEIYQNGTSAGNNTGFTGTPATSGGTTREFGGYQAAATTYDCVGCIFDNIFYFNDALTHTQVYNLYSGRCVPSNISSCDNLNPPQEVNISFHQAVITPSVPSISQNLLLAINGSCDYGSVCNATIQWVNGSTNYSAPIAVQITNNTLENVANLSGSITRGGEDWKALVTFRKGSETASGTSNTVSIQQEQSLGNSHIHAFPFDDDNVSDQLGDLVGTNSGTVDTTGKIGDARTFGVNDYISYDGPFYNSSTGNYSVWTWIKPNSACSQRYDKIIYQDDSHARIDMHFDNTNGATFGVEVNNGASWVQLFNASPPNNVYTHVGFVVNPGNNVSLYINGTRMQTKALSALGTSGASVYDIGGYSAAASTYYFCGDMDDVNVVYAAMTDEQMLLTKTERCTYENSSICLGGAGVTPQTLNVTVTGVTVYPTTVYTDDPMQVNLTCVSDYNPINFSIQAFNGSTAYGSPVTGTVANNTPTNVINISSDVVKAEEGWYFEATCSRGSEEHSLNSSVKTIQYGMLEQLRRMTVAYWANGSREDFTANNYNLVNPTGGWSNVTSYIAGADKSSKVNGSDGVYRFTQPTLMDTIPDAWEAHTYILWVTWNQITGHGVGEYGFGMTKQNNEFVDRHFFECNTNGSSDGTCYPLIFYEHDNAGTQRTYSNMTVKEGKTYLMIAEWSEDVGQRIYINNTITAEKSSENNLMSSGAHQDFRFCGQGSDQQGWNITCHMGMVINQTLTQDMVDFLYNGGQPNISIFYPFTNTYNPTVASVPSFGTTSFNVTSNSAYTTTKTYEASINITNTNGTVFLEWNYTNMSVENVSGEFVVSLGKLHAGTYSYKWHAYNPSGTLYSSSRSNYIVQKASGSVSIGFNDTPGIDYPSLFRAYCGNINSEVTPTLTRNGSSISNNSVQTLGVGNYTFTCSLAASQNYTSASSTDWFNIIKLSQSLSISISPSDTITTGTETTATGLNNLTVGTLYRNGVLVSNPDTQTLGIGEYEYIFNTSGNDNISAASATSNLTVLNVSVLLAMWQIKQYSTLNELFSVKSDGTVNTTGIVHLKKTDAPASCNAATEGAIYYDNSNNIPCYCDGSSWTKVSGGAC